MLVLKIIIWFFLFIIVYSYLGYGILLYILVGLKRMMTKKKSLPTGEFEPEVT